MANFLDLTTGLPALWAKIKSKFYTKAEVDALIPEDEVMWVNITFDSDGNYIANKTGSEAWAAIDNGKIVYGVLYDEEYLEDYLPWVGNGFYSTSGSKDYVYEYDDANSYSLTRFEYGKIKSVYISESSGTYSSSVNFFEIYSSGVYLRAFYNNKAYYYSRFYNNNENGGMGYLEYCNIDSPTSISKILISADDTVSYVVSSISVPNASSSTPEMDGDAAVGVSTAYARADHVHPSDTSRAAVVDVLTKTNTTSYTPTADYNPATKKYVDDSIPAPDVFWVNIEWTSGSGNQAIYTADKSYNEVDNAINNGKSVLANEAGQIYYWDGYYYTSFVNDEGSYYLKYFSYINIDTNNTLSASTYSWADASSMEYKANTWDVLTKTNTTSYTPTANYHPATKKYVDDSIPSASTTAPSMDGTASYGSGTSYARANHVHPTDTSRAAASDVLTKTNTTSYTPSADYNPATKKYVDDSISSLSSDLFIVNFTKNGSTYTSDKTYSEIVSAVANGKTVIGKTTVSSNHYWYTLVQDINSSSPKLNFSYTFLAEVSGREIAHTYQITIDDTNTITTRDWSNYTSAYNTQIYAGRTSIAKSNHNGTSWPVNTATNAYNVGDLVWFKQDKLIKITANVSAGGTLTENTNYVTTTIADEIANTTTDLAGLTDTTISSPTDGQVLIYDSATSKWINSTPSSGVTETRVNELIAAALAQYGDGDTATYGYDDASEVNY